MYCDFTIEKSVLTINCDLHDAQIYPSFHQTFKGKLWLIYLGREGEYNKWETVVGGFAHTDLWLGKEDEGGIKIFDIRKVVRIANIVITTFSSSMVLEGYVVASSKSICCGNRFILLLGETESRSACAAVVRRMQSPLLSNNAPGYFSKE